MLRFILQRLGLAALSVWAVCTIVFFIAALAPGDPAEIAAGGKSLSPAALARTRHEFGLDRPLGVRYVAYVWDALHGNLGKSFYDREPVTHFFARALPNTAILAVTAIGLALLVGIAVGLLAALRPNSVLDRLLMASILTGVTLPNFVLAPVLILLLAVKLGWLPVAGWSDPITGAIQPEYVVLPAVVLAARPAALTARLTRASLLETLRQDYIRTARAKGLSPARILFRHALKNAFLPVLTTAGVSFGYLLSGSFVVETIFTVPGVGYESIHSLSTRDYSLIQGTTLLLAVIFVTVNLIVDILYALLDPRVKVTEGAA
ncbi:MAG: ABC transporter permease [Armatimonadetes bacterium]|nr:ABC transporter permease [Armatimonadota bacterium]